MNIWMYIGIYCLICIPISMLIGSVIAFGMNDNDDNSK
jgi:uncharacterized membrane protein